MLTASGGGWVTAQKGAAPVLSRISPNAIDYRLICSMVAIEKIDFIPFHAKNNVLTTGRRPQNSQVKTPRLVPSFFDDDV
jgi:hypothetical protein